MKSIKVITLVLVNVICLNILTAQHNGELTLTTKINPAAATEIHLYLDVELDYEYADQKIVSTEINVASNIKKLSVMRHLNSEKRYNLITRIEEGKMKIFMPYLRKIITVNGKIFEDKVYVKMYIPEGIKVIKHIGPNSLERMNSDDVYLIADQSRAH